jgi:hypothetical protein
MPLVAFFSPFRLPATTGHVFAAVVVVAALVGGCGVPPPDRLEIVPPTMIKANEVGASTKLATHAFRGVAAHDDTKAPLVVTWTSSDAAVATVDAGGTVTATGSGKAKITASVPGAGGQAVTAEVDVVNVIVSSVSATGDFPKKFRLDSPPVRLTVVVKDEKGNVVEKPKVTFRATDYCVQADPDGVVAPLAVGECSVIVESAGKTAKIDLDVKE